MTTSSPATDRRREPPGRRRTWRVWRGWTWSGAPWRRLAVRRAAQGKDVGRGGRSPGRAACRRRAAAELVWSRPGQPRSTAARCRRRSDLARSRGWSPRVAEGTVFGQWTAVVGEQIAEHADPERAERRGAQRRRRSHGLGHPAADGAGATVGQDRGGGRRRCGDVAEDHRPDRSVLAEGQAAHLRPGPARHLRMSGRGGSAESHQNGTCAPTLRRPDAPGAEIFRARRS